MAQALAPPDLSAVVAAGVVGIVIVIATDHILLVATGLRACSSCRAQSLSDYRLIVMPSLCPCHWQIWIFILHRHVDNNVLMALIRTLMLPAHLILVVGM